MTPTYIHYMMAWVTFAHKFAQEREPQSEMVDIIHSREFTDRVWEVWEELDKI